MYDVTLIDICLVLLTVYNIPLFDICLILLTVYNMPLFDILILLTVYDVTNRASFQKLDVWLNELETFSTKHDLIKMLVGNKIDQVSVKVQ